MLEWVGGCAIESAESVYETLCNFQLIAQGKANCGNCILYSIGQRMHFNLSRRKQHIKLQICKWHDTLVDYGEAVRRPQESASGALKSMGWVRPKAF